MTDLLARTRALWIELAGVPVAFEAAAVTVVVSPDPALCPPGWVGIVTLGDAAIATAPDDASAAAVRRALTGLTPSAMIDPAVVQARVPVAATLGPAALAYCDGTGFRGAATAGVHALPVDHDDVAAFLAAVPSADADEAGLDAITSPAFVVRAGSGVVAAAGYRDWPAGTAHVGVLTAPDHRGRGLARAVASAAVADAVAAGRLAQWRARVPASRRVARALGFTELGGQLSGRLRPSRPA